MSTSLYAKSACCVLVACGCGYSVAMIDHIKDELVGIGDVHGVEVTAVVYYRLDAALYFDAVVVKAYPIIM
jgi:hypothetical protein